jgi:allantoate deiminase
MALRARDVIRECRVLAAFTEEPGFTTRTFLSPPMHGVHAHLRQWMTRLGMDVRVDAVGNLRGRRPASSGDTPTLFIGSHLDSVPRAGAFDGILGVVLGLALVELIGSAPLPFTIEVVGFSEEEGVRFGVPFIGSRGLVGSVDDALLARTDSHGVTVLDAIRDFGLDPAEIGEAAVSARAVSYLEFHIEQGPVLDGLGLPVGLVEAIVGLTRGEIHFSGRANHAGTTPMSGRRDAVVGAAEWILEVESLAKQVPGLVATVGRIEATPGATNVIAGDCRCSLDVRHADDRRRGDAVAALLAAAERIANARHLTQSWHPRLDQPAVSMNTTLVQTLERAVEQTGLPAHRMASGAGHDAMIMAQRMRAGMLFLRSPGGISHHPSESVLEDDVAAALQVGRACVLSLAEHHA